MDSLSWSVAGVAMALGFLKFIFPKMDSHIPVGDNDPAQKKTTRLTALYYRDGSFAGWFNLNKKQ